MGDIPLARGDWYRQVAVEARIATKNRFVEGNPTLTDGPFTMVVRPALRKFEEVGTGPIRSTFDQPGVFNDDLFVMSGTDLYRVSSDSGEATLIATIGASSLGDVSWAATAPIGSTPARLFLCEGGVLWVYTEDGEAIGHFEATGAIADGNVVKIDTTYYEFESGSVDGSSPAGTVGNPWRVRLGASNAEAIQNLYNAINDTGVAGTDYSTALVEHPTVRATAYATADLYVNAKTPGAIGNLISTTETGANTQWGAITLEDGGDPMIRQVTMPGDIGAISLDHINSYVIVIPVQDEETESIGRFYWIEPGETFVDAINFATAERTADKLHQVKTFSDQFWLFGQVTTEPWITTGDPDAPMLRFQGVLYDRGSWEGTALKLKDSLIIIDEDGGVFRIRGGLERISQMRPDIEERIRRAMQTESQFS